VDNDLSKSFEKYADLAIKVGLNLQKGQRLVISSPIAAAELTRAITAKAYDVGCPYVDVNFVDEELSLIRFQHAPKDSFKEFPTWRIKGNIERAKEGAAFLSIARNNPDLLKDQDPNLVAVAQKTAAEQSKPFSREYISTMKVSWCVISAAVGPWAARVFPETPEDEQIGKLWDAIFQMCRLDEEDPTAAWQKHIETLERRRAFLNERAYTALKYKAPGTDLTLGLPEGHVWKGGVDTNVNGTLFVPNIPTEEVFTMPHCQRTDGMVSSTKPLNYGGTMIENFSLTFQAGRVVGVEAETGRDVLKKLVETDEGAARLGEVALVPNSSPISKFGKLFYNTLFDENASNHVALGQAYNVCVEHGETMSEEDFSKAGGNTSVTHVDFMIGSGEMDIDGVLPDGSTEAVMRAGEWAFEA
jgi:aminopeptidase